VGSGQWAVGSGQWAVGSGQWAVDSGQESGIGSRESGEGVGTAAGGFGVNSVIAIGLRKLSHWPENAGREILSGGKVFTPGTVKTVFNGGKRSEKR